MSSSTPNINLTLPDGSENVSRQTINDNYTKIDTEFGTQSQAIANVNSKVEPQSIPINADLNNYISTGVYYIASNAVAAEVANTPVNIAGTLSVAVFGNSPMSGNWANLIQTYTSINGITYNRRVNTNGTGAIVANAWQELALKPTVLKNQTISVSKNSSATINIPTGYTMVFAVIDHGSQTTATLSTATNYTTNKIVFMNTSTSFDQTVTYSLVCIP